MYFLSVSRIHHVWRGCCRSCHRQRFRDVQSWLCWRWRPKSRVPLCGRETQASGKTHGDVMIWGHFPHYRFVVRGLHESSVQSPHRRASDVGLWWFLCCKLIYWLNTRFAVYLRSHGDCYWFFPSSIFILNGKLFRIFRHLSTRCIYFCKFCMCVAAVLL